MTVALGTTFHRDHFVCFECAEPLPANNFRQREGELYCEKDFHKLFTVKCDFCHDPIIHVKFSIQYYQYKIDSFSEQKIYYDL